MNRTSINQQNSTSPPSSNNATSHATNNRTSPLVDRTRDDSEPRSYENRSSDQRNLSNASPVRNQGLNGLKNIGNTCFMNSVIQCLSNTRYLLEYVREEGYMEDINTSISSMKGALIKGKYLVPFLMKLSNTCNFIYSLLSSHSGTLVARLF